jgi:hypothetical protein
MPQPSSDPFAGFGAEPAQASDPFDGFGPERAVPKALGAITANPQQAAEAASLAARTGVSGQVINADMDSFKLQKKATEASHYVANNPYIADLVTGTPLAPEVFNDSYGSLDKISTEGTKLNDHPIIKSILSAMKEGFGQMDTPITPEQREAFPKLSQALEPLAPITQFPEAAMRVVNSAIYGGVEGLSQLLTAGGISDDTTASMKKEAINFIGFMMAERGAAKVFEPRPGLVNATIKQQLKPTLAPPTLTPAETTHLEAGEVPPPGSGPITDHLHNIQAHVDAAQMDKVVEAVQDAKERSPEILKTYLDQILGDREAGVPVDKVNDLYKGKTPGPDDGILNLDPGQIDMANASGTDVKMKLSKLLAEIDPPAYEKLRDDLRLRDEGVTLTEAKDLDLDQPKESDPDTLMYQGVRSPRVGGLEKGSPQRSEYWTSNLEMAKTYAGSDGFVRAAKWSDFPEDAKARGVDARGVASALKLGEGGKPATVHQVPELGQLDAAAKPEDFAKLSVRENVKKSFYFQPLFKDAKAVGMDEAQYKKYFDGFVDADNADFQKRIEQEQALAKRQLTPEWKAAEPEIRQQVTDEFNGYDTINQGFNNAPAGDLKAKINAEVQTRMEAKFGGNIASLTLEQARENALHGRYIDLMDDEYKAIAKAKGGEEPLSLGDIKQWVKSSFDDLPRSQIKYETFRRGAEKAYADAAKALSGKTQKFDEALKAQQRRIVSSLMAKEARKFEKEVGRDEKVFDRITKNDKISGIDQEHLDQAHKILSDYGYTDKQFQGPQKPLPELIAESNRQLALAHWIVDGTQKDYKDFTAYEHGAFANSIKSMMHVGKQAKLIDSVHGSAEIDNVAFNINKEMERFDFVKQPLNKSIAQRVGSVWRWINARGLLVERMLDYSDQFNPRGPITSFMDRPLRDSYNTELKLSEQVRDHLRNEVEPHVDTSINEPINNRYLWDPNTQDYMNMTRKNLRHFIGYMGSESGINKVVKGFKIDPIAAWNLIRENATKSDIAWANGMWKLQDMLWPKAAEMERRYTGVAPDGIEPRPFSIKLKDGTAIEATGGYKHISYDRTRGTIEADLAKKGDLFDPNYFYSIETPHSYMQPRTGYAGYLDLTGNFEASHLQGMVHDVAFRESVNNAMKLINHPVFMDSIKQRWGQEYADLLRPWIKDIANVHNVDESYAQGAMAAMAAIRQNVISTLIFWNPGTYIKHSATALSMSLTQATPKDFAGALSKFKVGDIFQSAKDLISSKERIAPDPDFVSAMKEITDPGDKGQSARDFIWNSSALMRNRQGPYMDTIRGAYNRVNDAGAFQTAAEIRQASINIGRMPIAVGDSLSAMPTWYAAYKNEFALNGDHDTAVNVADRAMTRAHGSKFIGDKAGFMRSSNTFSGELARWFTPLMGFWNHNMQNLLQMGWDIEAVKNRGMNSEPGATIGSISGRFIATVIVPIIIEELAAPALSQDKAGGYGRQMFMATLRYFGSYVPGARDFTNAVAGGYEPSVGLLGTVYRNLSSFANDVKNKGVGKTVNQDWLTHLMTTFGFATGVGGTQVGKTLTGIGGLATGRERPQGQAQYRQLLRTGHTRPTR